MSTFSIDRRRAIAGTAALAGFAIKGPAVAGPLTFFDRKGLLIGLELYTVYPEATNDLDRTLAAVAAIGYRVVEIPNFLGKTPAELRVAFDGAGIVCPSMQLAPRGPGSFDGDAAKLADDLRTIGVKTAIMSGNLPQRFGAIAQGEDFAGYVARIIPQVTADDWLKVAEGLNAKGRRMQKVGIRLGYHNHNFELAPTGGSSGLQILIDNTDPALVTFEIDVGWVSSAGVDPVAFLKRNKGRISHLHVKDIGPGTRPNFALGMEPAEVGSGTIDWKRVLATAWDAGVREFYVEQEPPFARPRLESARMSHDFLKSLVA